MKATLTENEGSFWIEFEAENVADAALLVRFRIGATKEIRSRMMIAQPTGLIDGSVVFGKAKNRVGEIR
jgi:hypothetical protein